ncbi:cyclic GMP-AMP synthase [Neoarius graeffei]|uniref:cyclic GMP-AMP synthase n=1 Tax=Neoarius graeffei TaxID=443677 RepID=UPI00298CF86E|nr:cyclic GMP-AMP synthase [Neoarius graeffei]
MVRGIPLKNAKDDNKEIVKSPVVPENKNLPPGNGAQKKLPFPKGDPRGEVAVGKDLPISNELDRWIRQRGRDLRLRLVDRQNAVKLVNNLIKDLVKFLKENDEQPFFKHVSVLNSGSYYEYVKINKPNEFDIMLKLKTPRIVWESLEKYNGLFYTISLSRALRGEIRSFLLEDGLTISASKIMNEMHHLVRKFIKKHKVPAGEGHWVVRRRKVNSPAVTLEFLEENKGTEVLSVDIVPALEVPQGWPAGARAGVDVDNWLGKNNRRKILGQPVFFVPKRPKARNLSDIEKESWRISFSHIEKYLIRFHGNKKTCCERKQTECCRKLCLRLLKCLFEGLKHTYPKELDPLCSYHGKTAFFYNLCERFEDSLWTPGQLSDCFMKLLWHFECAVNDGSLPHFFVPDHNLFSPSTFPRRSLQFLGNALKEQRESGLPLLQVPDPAPALCYSPDLQLQPQQISPEPKCDTVACGSSSFQQNTILHFGQAMLLVACTIFLTIICTHYI